MSNTERIILTAVLGAGLGYLAYNIFLNKGRNKEALNYVLFGIVLLSINEYRDYKNGKDSFFDFGTGGQKSKAVGGATQGILNGI